MSSYLKDKKVLVTGGAGFIGSHIVDRLIALGAKVVVLDNLVSGKVENLKGSIDKVDFIQKDLRENSVLEEALAGVDLICHQAALRSVPKSVSTPYLYHDVNVTGTLKLFLKAKERGIKKIVWASSSSVYGECNNFPQKEDYFCKPVSPYAASKLMGEYYADVFSKLYGMEIISLRYFNVYGPRQSLDDEYAVVIPKFINCLLNSKNCPIYGDGFQERDFTFIDDVATANVLSLTKENLPGETFNIASNLPYSVNSLFKSLKSILKSSGQPEYFDSRPGDVRKTHADIAKAKKLLGWEPKVDFSSGLKKTVDWFKNR